MPFSNPIVGGTVLIRPAIKSPDFVEGVSGWSINKDGSAEFNDVTIRGGTVVSGESLYYDPSPGPGNLVLSIAAEAGVDEFGNTYPQGLSIGNDLSHQINLDYNGSDSRIAFSVNNGNAATSGTLLEAVLNEGAPNELLSMQAHSPTVNGFTDHVILLLNSQALDGTSESNAIVQHTDGNLMTLDPNQALFQRVLRVIPNAATASSVLAVNPPDATTGRLLELQRGSAEKLGVTSGGRLRVLPDADPNSAILVNAATGYTGFLLRLQLNADTVFSVDPTGDVAVAGSMSVTGSATADNMRWGGATTPAPGGAPAQTSVNVVFADAMPDIPRVVITPDSAAANLDTTNIRFAVTNRATTGFTINCWRDTNFATNFSWTALSD